MLNSFSHINIENDFIDPENLLVVDSVNSSHTHIIIKTYSVPLLRMLESNGRMNVDIIVFRKRERRERAGERERADKKTG